MRFKVSFKENGTLHEVENVGECGLMYNFGIHFL